MTERFDVAIVGGGMVGASLGVALAPLGLRVALVEAHAHDGPAQPSFDERTTALSNGSRRILETLGLWEALAAAVTPIRKIHVSDRGRFGFARIEAVELGLKSLGFVVPNRALGAALWARLQTSPVRIYCPADVARVTPIGDGVALQIAAADGSETAIEASLIVAADGADSAVRGALGIEVESREYGQTAIITCVLPQRFHDHVAYERFTEEGPLALLPLEDGRCTLVLTVNQDAAQSVLAWTDEEFLAEAQRRFGFRLGRFLRVGRRAAYRLSLTQSMRTSATRCAIIGNAAQGLHPVAGMGFNLGLRDAASLAELIAEHRRDVRCDSGAPDLLAAYDAWRAQDRRAIIAFTDGLVRVFSNPLRTLRGLRNLALLAFDLLPPAKTALSALSVGAAGRVPKLARGVPIH